MKTAVALRHVYFENLGILKPLLEALDYAVEYVEAVDGAISQNGRREPDLLVVLGGPIGVYDSDKYPFVEDTLHWIERRLAQQLPVLGICLGAQLIARAMGARVYATGTKHIGFEGLLLTDYGRTSPLASLETTPVLHWHGDTFELPEGCRLLAGASDGTHQAFAFGTNVLALQFHLEADLSHFEHWLVGHYAELAAADVDPRQLRAQALEAESGLCTAACAVFAEWIQGLETSARTAPGADSRNAR